MSLFVVIQRHRGTEIKEKVGNIDGVIIEEKRFSTAVHYRLVKKEHLEKIDKVVKDVVEANKPLRVIYGKKVYEIMPAIAWNKGMAVRWIMKSLGISFESACVVYIGDDTTDEDAFRVVRTRGLGILVSEKPKKSSASFMVKNPKQLKTIFEKLLISS